MILEFIILVNEDKATRYHRLKRRAHVVSLVWSVAFLGGLLWSGLTLTLRSGADTVAASTAPALLSRIPDLSRLFTCRRCPSCSTSRSCPSSCTFPSCRA